MVLVIEAAVALVDSVDRETYVAGGGYVPGKGVIGMSKRLGRCPVVVSLVLTIAMCGTSWTWARPTADSLVGAPRDRLLLSEDDDSENGAEYECVAGQGALVGPLCVKVESIGENVLFL